ncbi:hypothetical protein Tco_0904866 [Tanacetum coccineum]
MSIAITNYSTRSSKSGKKRFQEFNDDSCIISGERFCFNPFRQVVNGHENVLVPSGRREWSHKVDAPGNGYPRKEQKPSQNGQIRARNGKA